MTGQSCLLTAAPLQLVPVLALVPVLVLVLSVVRRGRG